MIAWAFPVIGALLLFLVATDVFLTGFHPSARAGPVVRVLSRGIWTVARGVGGHREQPKDRLLSLAGPAIALGTPIAWILLLGLGFWFIYFPYVLSFHYQPGTPGAAWLEAAYYSGYVLFTLGLGDVVADGPAFRLLTILEAGAGFGVFSIAMAYVLSVYGEQSVQTGLANTIDHALGDAPVGWSDPPEPVRSWAGDFALTVATSLGAVNAARKQYPILNYFRLPADRDSLPVQVARLVRWIRELERADGATDLFQAYSPFLTLRRAVDEYLIEARTHFVPERLETSGGGADEEDRERDLRRLLAYLCYPAGTH